MTIVEQITRSLKTLNSIHIRLLPVGHNIISVSFVSLFLKQTVLIVTIAYFYKTDWDSRQVQEIKKNLVNKYFIICFSTISTLFFGFARWSEKKRLSFTLMLLFTFPVRNLNPIFLRIPIWSNFRVVLLNTISYRILSVYMSSTKTVTTDLLRSISLCNINRVFIKSLKLVLLLFI